MSKPDDIPQDVWIAANAGLTSEMVGVHVFSVQAVSKTARAIMAERERCAAMVEAIGSDTDPQLADYLANCLRNPPQTPPLLSQEEAFQRAVKAGMWNGLVSKPEDTTI